MEDVKKAKKKFLEQFSLHEAMLEAVPQTLILTFMFVAVLEDQFYK